MTAAELTELVGRSGVWRTIGDCLKIRIKTLDARQSYGRVDVRITPEAGNGEAWVDSDFVTLDK